MAKTPPKSADQLIIEALERALLACGETRLIAFGKKQENTSLFPDEKGTRKSAVEKCLYQEPTLLKVVRTDDVQVGKQKQINRFVTITPDGIKLLFSRLPPDRAGELFSQALRQISADLVAQRDNLDTMARARQQVVENAQALIQQFGEIANRIHAAGQDATEKVALLKTRLDTLPLPPALAPPPSERPPLRRPNSEEEARFRQRAAQELVFAWQAASANGREPIEAALFNLGAEPIGRAGERVDFAGRIHESNEPVFPGDPVEVIRPGWMLRDELGGYLLAHAQVKSIQKPSE